MTDKNSIKFSKSDVESLLHLSDLLHLFNHRNKNQHRRSVWWRHFSVFRRQINGLNAEVQNLNAVPTTHLERSHKKTKDDELRHKILKRLDFWRDILVPRWQNAFSQVIANGRFAVLGLVLTAILAQACQISGIIVAYEDLAQSEVEKVLEDFGKELWGEIGKEEDQGVNDGEDLGELIDREDLLDAPMASAVLPPLIKRSLERSDMEQSTKISKTGSERKKRKKGDAIDDLFSGLD